MGWKQEARRSLMSAGECAASGLNMSVIGGPTPLSSFLSSYVALFPSLPPPLWSLTPSPPPCAASSSVTASAAGYPPADQIAAAQSFTAKACAYGGFLLTLYFGLAAVWCMCYMPMKNVSGGPGAWNETRVGAALWLPIGAEGVSELGTGCLESTPESTPDLGLQLHCCGSECSEGPRGSPTALCSAGLLAGSDFPRRWDREAQRSAAGGEK